MNDEPHTIPDHVAARVARLINEAEDMRQQSSDDLKQIYADLREELRGMGWTGFVVSTEVAALKGAISELRLDDEKKAKREEKGERIGDYVSMLSRARAREGQSYAEAKGPADTPEQPETAPHSNPLHHLPAADQPGAGDPLPLASGPLSPDPHLEGLTTGDPNPSSDAGGAKCDGAHSIVGQGGHEPDIRTAKSEQQDASAAQTGNEAGYASGATVTLSDEAVPAFLKPKKTAADYLPNCQNPGNCAGIGLHHCYQCKKAMAESEAA